MPVSFPTPKVSTGLASLALLIACATAPPPTAKAQTTAEDAVTLQQAYAPATPKNSRHWEMAVQLPIQKYELLGVQASFTRLRRLNNAFSLGLGAGYMASIGNSLRFYGRLRYAFATSRRTFPYVTGDLGLANRVKIMSDGDGGTYDFEAAPLSSLHVGFQRRHTDKLGITASIGYTYTSLNTEATSWDGPGTEPFIFKTRHPGFIGFRLGLVY